ncbi:MAG: hypothetical protein K0Q79_3669 [Flavipsychrobacter sp.]|jgi:tetratricopeptide (TPR) repeat protein|nr:hypothetical protein [Flavipsychrobacter sp.]
MSILNKYCKASLVFITCAVLSFTGSAQTNIDSIKSLVQRLSSDSDKVNTLLDLSKGVGCFDSVKKLAIAFEAKQIASKMDWAKGMRNANNAIGLVYLQCEKDSGNAFKYFRANITLAKKNKDVIAEALALDIIAKEYGEINQHQKAIETYYEELALEPGVTKKASIYGNIGTAYKAVGEYRGALNFYDSARNLLNSKKHWDIQDTLELAGVYVNRGEVYLSISNPDRALAQFDSVLNSGIALKDKQFYIWGMIGRGKAYRLKKNYEKAVSNYEDALLVCKDINAFGDEVSIDGELAHTYMETGDINKALSYADAALSLAETQHYINQLSKCNTILGNIYTKQGKYELAISYLRKALEIAGQTKNLEDQRDAWGALSIAFKQSGDWQQAFYADQTFKALSDSLFGIDKLNAITRAEISAEYKNKRKHDSLQTQMVFAKRIERQRVLTYSGFIGLILVLALAFFMFRNYKTQKKYNELLNREKQRHLAHIEAQSNVLSEISHIQAHQIRGPVSTILGLVHIFNYDDATDPMNKQVMEWITSTTEKLDVVIKDIITRENNLRTEHEEEEAKKNNPQP